MRGLLSGLSVGLLVLCLGAAVLFFGAVNITYAAPAFALAAGMALLWVVKLLFASPVSWKHSPMHIPVALFVLYTIYRYATSPIEYESRLELFRVLLYAFVYFYVICNLYRSRDRSILIGVLIFLGIAESIYAFWQFGTKAKTVLHLIRPEQYQNRGGGTFICPNHLAGYLEMVLGMVLARIAIMRSSRSIQKSALRKVFTTYAALVVLGGLIVTFSRGGWIATIVGFLTFLLLKGWQPGTLIPRIATAAVGLLIVAFIGFKFRPVQQYVHVTVSQHEEREEVSRDPSLGSRVSMWKASWEMFKEHPVIGVGPGTWMWRHLQYRDPMLQFRERNVHNDYLHLAAEFGAVGFLIVIGFLVAFFWHASKFLGPENHSDERSFAMGTITAMVMILVHSFFDFNMHIPSNALILMALVATMAAMEDGQKVYRRVEMTLFPRLGLSLFLLIAAGGCIWFYGRNFMADREANLGSEAKQRLDYERAVQHYEESLKYDPKSPEAYAKLGDIYSNHGSIRARPGEEAERKKFLEYAAGRYVESLDLNPFQSDVLVRLAVTYERMGELESALEAFRGAQEIDPHNAFTYLRLGLFYQNQGDVAKAKEAFTKSRDLNFWSDDSAKLNLKEIEANPGPP